jgi:mannitol-1-phosphate/altronate dehydrogenase
MSVQSEERKAWEALLPIYETEVLGSQNIKEACVIRSIEWHGSNLFQYVDNAWGCMWSLVDSIYPPAALTVSHTRLIAVIRD